jgi:Tol biopolymer transport system component
MIAFVNDTGGVPQIWIKNLNTGDPVQITSAEIPGARPRWSPTNDQIVFSSGSFEISRESENIWSVPPLGGTPQNIIEQGRNPNWSFDGRLLVFERKDEIWIAKADGSGQSKVHGVPTVPLLLADRLPAFSPDSSQIVFFQMTNGPIGDYWIISSAGGQPRQITFDNAAGGRAVWTPDGKFIIFPSSRAGSLTLWKIPASGGDPVAITTGAGLDADPEISRDGKRLIFTNKKYSSNLKLYDTKTGISRDLLKTKNIVAPVFSVDGNRIAFFSNKHLFTMEKSGAHVAQLTRDKNESDIFPRWSHDGSSIFFYQQTPEPSFRKIAINGGPSIKVLENWTWETEYGAQPDPSEEYIVYSKRKEGTVIATFIRHLKTGKERALSMALDDPRWSRDRKWIAGYSIVNKMNDSIYICPSDGGSCRRITKGSKPVWSGDDSRLYFQRKGELEDGAELWSVSINGSNEKKETELSPMLPIAFFYDVSITDEILWVQSNLGTSELWLMEFGAK